MMGDKEKIEVLIAREKNAASFARKVGASESTIAKIRSGLARLAPLYERLANTYPTLNCRWLLTGEGEPFGEELSKEEISERLNEIESTLRRLCHKMGTRS